MGDYIPNIELHDFTKIVEAGKVGELKSCEVYNESGEYLFTAIIGHTDIDSRTFARMRSDALGGTTNIVGGYDPADVLKTLPVDFGVSDKYANLAKAREALKAKREAEKVNA